jgi:hypothetical protein
MTPWNTQILPGEHIGSLVIRTHILSGHKQYKATAKGLGVCGNTTLKAQDFNSASLFTGMVKHTSSGTASDVANTHSPAPLWSLSLEKTNYHGWCPLDLITMNKRLDCNISSLNKSWHLCKCCVEDDLIEHGFSYWHTAHQLPGITHCYIHKTPLMTCTSLLRDLRLATLPQVYVNELQPQYPNTEVFSQWSTFVFNCFAALRKDPNQAKVFRNAARELLNLPKTSRARNKHIFEHCLSELEHAVDTALLAHIFRSYSNTNKPKSNFIKKSILNEKSANYRSPVSWLLILFWLRNKIDLGL